MAHAHDLFLQAIMGGIAGCWSGAGSRCVLSVVGGKERASQGETTGFDKVTRLGLLGGWLGRLRSIVDRLIEIDHWLWIAA